MLVKLFPPQNRPVTEFGKKLQKRFPIKVYAEEGVSASCLYPTHWRIFLRVFGFLIFEYTRPFKSMRVDPWWVEAVYGRAK